MNTRRYGYSNIPGTLFHTIRRITTSIDMKIFLLGTPIVGIWTLWACAHCVENQGGCILVLCVEGIFVRNILIFRRVSALDVASQK